MSELEAMLKKIKEDIDSMTDEELEQLQKLIKQDEKEENA